MQISEKEIEDWVCEELEHVCAMWEGLVVVGRQITLSSGRRMDILAAREVGGGHHLVVIEVKAVPVTMGAFAQILDYMTELAATLNAQGAGNAYRRRECWVSGVLVGPSPDESVRQAVAWNESVSLCEVSVGVQVARLYPPGTHPSYSFEHEERRVAAETHYKDKIHHTICEAIRRDDSLRDAIASLRSPQTDAGE